MEINDSELRLADSSTQLTSAYVKQENQESESSDLEAIVEADTVRAVEIKERSSLIRELGAGVDDLDNFSLTFNALGNHANGEPIGQDSSIDEEIQRRMSQATRVFIDDEQVARGEGYDSLSGEFLNTLGSCIKKRGDADQAYQWLCDVTDETNNAGAEFVDKRGLEIPAELEATISSVSKRKGRTRERYRSLEAKASYPGEKAKRRAWLKGIPRQDYRERLLKKAECMREKRRKLYEEESEEERLKRLAKEAAKRREMRMYYETPEQRRKRLDAEAARKREYRMYNETPDERRKRLDREAERRRVKRLTLYASETAEQRRERLNRESAKRREARLNQYSKETEEERRERLRKDALRAREMRFTRSAIETEEERKQSFEELNNAQTRDEPDNQLGSHYLSNWMMWLQNTLTQPVHVGEQIIEPQSHNNG